MTLNLRIPLCICRREGWTSLCMMSNSCKLATAEASCLKMLRVWKILISVLQNYFQVLMWSGDSVRKATVLISSRKTTSPSIFSRFGWFPFLKLEIKFKSGFWSWNGVGGCNYWLGQKNVSGGNLTIVIKLSLLNYTFHSITTSPSFCEYSMSGNCLSLYF